MRESPFTTAASKLNDTLLMGTKLSSRDAAYLNKYEILEDVPGGL